MIFPLRRLACALGLLLVGLATGAAADHPAGIILYAQDARGVSLLLADHQPPSRRGWAAFGGTHEAGESPAETAARETEEETNGFFPRAALLAKIKDTPPLFDGAYAFYFVKVPLTPAAEIARGRSHADDEAYRERGPFAWVPYAEIARQLDAEAPVIDPRLLPAETRTNRLWPVWMHNLQVAREAHALPWEKPRTGAADGGRE
jgi:8-oxo-dGTP pyrophosphatase MutT (NUDIX family)